MHNRPDEERFQTEKERELAVIAAEAAVEGKAYPDRLSPNMITQKKERPLKIHYLRRYSVASLIFMFSFSHSSAGHGKSAYIYSSVESLLTEVFCMDHGFRYMVREEY